MNRNFHWKFGSAVIAALLPFGALHAIEAPKPAPPPEQPAPAPLRTDINATDETKFYGLLQRVSAYRSLRGLGIPIEVVDALGRGEMDVAVGALSNLANQGNQGANVALVRIQHLCNGVSSSRAPDPQTQIGKLSNVLQGERASRAAGVIRAEAEFTARARANCGRARFDYQGIEGRLRQAASAGDPVSATELSQFLRDPAKKKALLQSAVDKKYAPAQYAEATNLLTAVQRGETTENVSQIRLLLKQAGRTVARAKLDLANCMSLGCDGHPADALSAQAFGLDAARDGEPTAFLSMVRMPWGGRLSRSQLLAWQYFGDRLNEAGCMGDGYVATSATFAQTIGMLEKNQDPKLTETAKTQAEDLWRDNGARAMKENGCG